MKRNTIFKQGRRVALTACTLLIGTQVFTTSCKDDDVLTGQPSWLGNSIYERLQEDGNYTTVLKLIDDLGQHEVLSHTGSKTLFAANDSAYDAWFKGNSWGVSSYSQLTTAQKKLLLNNSMINNAYLIELMSNVSGTPPMEGMAMRRETAASIYDSVYIMPAEQMPGSTYWADFKSRGKSIPIFKDGTSAPMIHFLPAFMRYYKITSEDLAVLTNHQASSTEEAWVNGRKVVERDITCKNGYIQKVDGVIESSPNMAEILRQHPQMSMWSKLIDRFSAPYYHAVGTREYNRINNTEDSVYTLRYFSDVSLGNQSNRYDPNGNAVSATLSFDPGWNHYMYTNTMNYDLHYDAGAMIVPTNEALEAWWNSEGRDLQDEYKEWDSIPLQTLSKLLRVNMLPSFTESVPSKFKMILDDAKESLGITIEDVDSCFMGCNGVVYMVNKVFSPSEYASVAYPALAHASTMNIVYWAIDQRNFLPYLLSMDSKYALLLPTNNAMLYYIDPATYGKTLKTVDENGDSVTVEMPHLIEFRYDPTKLAAERVQASRYNSYVYPDGTIEKRARQQREVNQSVINTMMDDLMNQLIIVIPDKNKRVEDYVREGYNYFKTKGGSLIRATFDNNGQLAFEGGWQMEHKHKLLPSTEQFEKANGVSYQLEDQMPMGAQKSLYMTLQEHPEYSNFLGLMKNDYSDLLTSLLNKKYTAGSADVNNENMRLFDNYNYTVYVPTNESIKQLQDQGYLPSFSDLEEKDDNDNLKLDSICRAENWPTSEKALDSIKTAMRTIVTDFVRYHVQDNSLAIGMAHDASRGDNNYESMKRNPETGRFFPITVNYDNSSMTIVDAMGNVRHVLTSDGLYNNIVREYWFDGTSADYSQRIFMASNAVVHLIDKPLQYENMKPWRQVVREYLNLQ